MDKNIKLFDESCEYIGYEYNEEDNIMYLKGELLGVKNGNLVGDCIFKNLINSNKLLILDFENAKIDGLFIDGLVDVMSQNPFYYIFSTHLKNVPIEELRYYYTKISYLFREEDNFVKINNHNMYSSLIDITNDITKIKEDINAIKIALGDQDEED